MKLISILISIMILSILSTGAAAHHFPLHSCAISTGRGLLQDFDCDKVPDYSDNCPDIYNPGQKNVCGPAFKQTVLVAAPEAPERKKSLESASEGIVDLKVQIKEVQDVYIGTAGAVYPIKITNKGKEAKRVVLDLQGASFGTYKIDPSTTLIAEPGQKRTAYLHVVADDNAKKGSYSMTLTVSSGNNAETVSLTANVLAKKTPSSILGNIVGWLIVALIIVIILLVVFISRKEKTGSEKTGSKKGKKDKDIFSYY